MGKGLEARAAKGGRRASEGLGGLGARVRSCGIRFAVQE